MIDLNEIERRTAGLEDVPGVATAAQQRTMLAGVLGIVGVAQGTGLPVTVAPVSVTYRKVTKAPPRLPGRDFAARPAAVAVAHEGPVVFVGRNRAGVPYFRLVDANRDRGDREGFTCVRLEGLRTFLFADPRVTRRAVGIMTATVARVG
jgi:hypothetical protein